MKELMYFSREKHLNIPQEQSQAVGRREYGAIKNMIASPFISFFLTINTFGNEKFLSMIKTSFLKMLISFAYVFIYIYIRKNIYLSVIFSYFYSVDKTK